MKDEDIVELYWARSERALAETEKSYGKYCRYIAGNILPSDEDCEECVNDAYLRAWETIPPQRPRRLSTYLGKLTRTLALDRRRYMDREKRGGGRGPLVFEEISECVPAPGSEEAVVDALALKECFDRFLAALPQEKRDIFVRRYWFFSPVKEIARDFSVSESRVKMTLLRLRGDLREILRKEGFSV